MLNGTEELQCFSSTPIKDVENKNASHHSVTSTRKNRARLVLIKVRNSSFRNRFQIETSKPLCAIGPE